MPRKRQFNRERTLTAICGIISSSNKGLDEICRSKPYFPSARAVQKWLIEDESLVRMYARAKEAQADFLAEEIRQLADECRTGREKKVKETKDGTFVEVVEKDMVERSRLQIDARKWLAAKLAPQKYGERMQVDQQVTIESFEQRVQRLTGAPLALDAQWSHVVEIEE